MNPIDTQDDANADEPAAYDVVVVGGGAAGLSAALVLARARRHLLVVDAGAPRNAPASHMHGYLSRDGMPPGDLLAAGRREVAAYGGELVSDTVTDVRPTGSEEPSFMVTLGSGRSVAARRVLLTTGLRDEIPDVPGLRERWGRDVLHCPYCHGYEVRDQPVGVLGGSAEAVLHAQVIRQWSADVLLFSHGGALTEEQQESLAARGIGVVEGAVAGLSVVDDVLRAVVLADGRTVPRAAVFVRPRFVPNGDLLSRLGCAVDDAGWASTDPSGRTTVAGVWAAGNVTNPRAQVITAAGEGSAAAIAINADLVEHEVAHAVHQSRSGARR